MWCDFGVWSWAHGHGVILFGYDNVVLGKGIMVDGFWRPLNSIHVSQFSLDSVLRAIMKTLI